MQPRPEPPRRPWETVAYTDNPDLPDIKDVKTVDKAFLPRPEALIFKESKSEEATITPDKEKATSSKNNAQDSGECYQKTVRGLHG